MGKIGITCRQPFLGALEWIEEEIKKAKNPTAGGQKEKNKEKEKKGTVPA
jgi:DNA-directed RNA polymerase subunit E'